MAYNVSYLLKWCRYVSIVLLALISFAALVLLIYEYVIVLQEQPNDLFARVRAILLTIAAVIGLPFLIWRTVIADRQNQINREGQYAELFGKSVELLSATRTGADGIWGPAVEARIGAIFALERLSKSSEREYGPIVETLSAYVCEQCGECSTFRYPGDDPDEEGISVTEKGERLIKCVQALHEWITQLRQHSIANRPDIRAALAVLARRKDGRQWNFSHGLDEVQPNLSGANLQGANLSEIMRGLAEEATSTQSRQECQGISDAVLLLHFGW